MKLKENALEPLNIHEIKPEGWLRRQLEIQANGLTGNLNKFWPDIMDSKWIGGNADGWERLPYWLDGYLPLAWLLDDSDMKAHARYCIDQIIATQADDGWICPEAEQERSAYDVWAFFLILKVLVEYHYITSDPRIENTIYKALKYLDLHIDKTTLFGWAQARWFEALIPIWWLYERKPEDWMMHLAHKLAAQGVDWVRFFQVWPYRHPDEKGRWSFLSHVVNNAMAVKSGPLYWRSTGRDEDLAGADEMLRLLDQYHGMVTGVFSGDECLAGISPIRGTELCSVVELMYSLEHLVMITGQSKWSDRLERIAYNALPATFSPDMWTHQYDQQVNQTECSIQEESIFGTNSGEAHIFGLEPNFGCCTANMHQGWPKLAMSTIMRTPDGLAVSVYAPCSIKTQIDGTEVEIQLDTEYPFRDEICFTIRTNIPVAFALWLRIPDWCKAPQLVEQQGIIQIQDRGYHKVSRVWQIENHFNLVLPMETQVVPRPNNLYAIVRGPLVYSLPIGERWVRVHEDMPFHEEPHADYEIYPETPWNYGLCMDEDNPEGNIKYSNHPIGDYPFSPEGAPITASVEGFQVEWLMKNGSVMADPVALVNSESKEALRLIPYGCTNLRMTEMPIRKP